MSKKLVRIISGLLVLIISGLLIYFFFFKGFKKTVSPLGEGKTNQQPEIKLDLIEWKDEAGFSFMYPKDAKITSLKDNPGAYSELEISEPNKKGKIVIICQDSNFSTIDEWLKKDKLVIGANALDTKIATQSAKRVVLGEGREIAGFIDPDQVIYTIDKQLDGEVYWQKVYSEILNSFKLIPLAGEKQSDFQEWTGDFGTAEDEADYVENVEVIQ